MRTGTKVSKISDDQILEVCHRWISDLGESWRSGGVRMMLWRASLKTGISTSRLRTIYYRLGAKVSASEHLIILINWKNMELDGQLAANRDRAASARKRYHDLTNLEKDHLEQTLPLFPELG